MSNDNGAHVEAQGTGTPPTSPNYGIPRYSGADPADFPTQVNAITDIVDAQMARRATVVTTLPGAPVDGQECYFVADAANGVVWHLKYRAADPSAHKWQFVGGPELLAGPSGSTSTASTAPVALASGPLITVPIAGDYEVEFGGYCQLTVAGITPLNFGTTLGAGTNAQLTAPSQWGGGQVQVAQRYNNLAAAAAAALVVWVGSALSCNFTLGWLKVKPIRLG